MINVSILLFLLDLNEVPLCELALSCDNLLCYPYGRPPSPMIVIHVKYPSGHIIQYATTEMIEVKMMKLYQLYH